MNTNTFAIFDRIKQYKNTCMVVIFTIHVDYQFDCLAYVHK